MPVQWGRCPVSQSFRGGKGGTRGNGQYLLDGHQGARRDVPDGVTRGERARAQQLAFLPVDALQVQVLGVHRLVHRLERKCFVTNTFAIIQSPALYDMEYNRVGGEGGG